MGIRFNERKVVIWRSTSVECGHVTLNRGCEGSAMCWRGGG